MIETAGKEYRPLLHPLMLFTMQAMRSPPLALSPACAGEQSLAVSRAEKGNMYISNKRCSRFGRN